MKSFNNKVAAITGAGSGIGRALALELAAQNCALSLSDVNETGLAETAKLLADSGVKVTTSKVDVSKLEQVQAWAKKTVKDHGKVNLIFNNAGVAVAGTVEGLSYEEYEWITNINFWGVVYGTKEFLPHLKASGEGHVINVSSVFGLFAQPSQSAYNATKFAVRGFTESLRQELDMTGTNVSATCVHPGGIKTNIARSARTNDSLREITGVDPSKATADFEKMFTTTAKKAAEVILAGVKRDARRVLIGNDARAFDVMQRLLPTAYQALVTRAMKAQSKRK
ncbi:SDR family NAD(P)-dependent oxidoreductase [Stenotrophobium rhamnosiphilum]|uniref:Short-chain dehydrogenase n=1 Tax=Stenotrophobium rhamnosiphilum TaxID=2029166 RepID=A0A2T5MIN4_9GAMM|nr:SDR family NAD(P)-dependent oxidoreductase [Stenotrophobium rhamnosiphilum]PTU32431.1 short-chain dehydrogenase [Stenotrophobium rhamnosiphilum]